MFGSIGPMQLAIVLLIVILIFGTKKLKGMGGDLGGAVKGFKDAMNKDQSAKDEEAAKNLTQEPGQDAEFEQTETKQKDQDKA